MSATTTTTTTTGAAAPPLGKFLASTEKKTRDKAIKNLAAFLSQPDHDAIPRSEMSKLWKGIFYCFWMSDKPLVQQALADELAELVLTISNTNASLNYLRGFWECTVREWNGIDRLRIDKYYLLIRRFVNASFRLLIRTEFEKSACEEYNKILSSPGGPLCPNDIKVAQGLAYHLSDIYIEELDKALAKSPSTSSSSNPTQSSHLHAIITPFLELIARTTNNVTYTRIQNSLFSPLFSALASSSSTAGEDDEDEDSGSGDDDAGELRRSAKRRRTDDYSHITSWVDVDDARKYLAKAWFEMASREDTRDANRRKMYTLWKGLGDIVDEDEE